MSLSEDMDRAHRRDYADKRDMEDLSRDIRAFLKDPPSRCDEGMQIKLRSAVEALEYECAHIVRVWD